MWFAISSIILYLLSVLLISPQLLRTHHSEQHTQSNTTKTLFFCTALGALIAHFISLSPLFSALWHGEDYGILVMGSLISAVAASLATLASLLQIRTLWLILPLVYCFAIIHIVFAALIPSHMVQDLSQNMKLLFHIGLSLFTYAVCFIATLYNIQLVWLDRNLKRKKMAFSPMIAPLMTVERHFIRLLLCGELLLTLTLISGSVFIADLFVAQSIPKAVFSLFAWLLFAIALFGHSKRHWRGKRMLIYTISGMILLSIAYFGSRLIFEI